MKAAENATAIVEEFGGEAVSYLKNKIFSALMGEDDAEALRLDELLQSVEKILGMKSADDF